MGVIRLSGSANTAQLRGQNTPGSLESLGAAGAINPDIEYSRLTAAGAYTLADPSGGTGAIGKRKRISTLGNIAPTVAMNAAGLTVTLTGSGTVSAGVELMWNGADWIVINGTAATY